MAVATKPGAGKKLSLTFDFEKETPGTNRYKEANVAEGERGAIGTLYVTKKALATLGAGTKTLKVTIEAGG